MKELEQQIVNGLNANPSDTGIWNTTLPVYLDWLAENGFNSTEKYFKEVMHMHDMLMSIKSFIVSKLPKYKIYGVYNKKKIERSIEYSKRKSYNTKFNDMTFEKLLSGEDFLEAISLHEREIGNVIVRSILNKGQRYWGDTGKWFLLELARTSGYDPFIKEVVNYHNTQQKKAVAMFHDPEIAPKVLQKERIAIKALNGTAKRKRPAIKEKALNRSPVKIKYKKK